MSDAPTGTPPEVLHHAAFGRRLVERCAPDAETERGLDHFGVRSYGSPVRSSLLGEIPDLTVCRARTA